MRTNDYEQDQILIPTKDGYTVIPAPNVRGLQVAEPEKSRSSIWLKVKNMAQFLLMISGMRLSIQKP